MEVVADKSYMIFGDSRCQYKLTEPTAKFFNYYVNRGKDIQIYYSFEEFNADNSQRKSDKF